MPSTFPSTPDDLGRSNLTHGDVTDALAAVETAVLELLTAAAPTTGAQFLSGSGAPASGSGLDPLDGVNDPWRWSSFWSGWISPAYRVTWDAGDTFQAPAGASLDVVVFSSDTALLTDSVAFDGHAETTVTGPVQTATDPGSGVGVVIQYEPNFTRTAVPDKTLDPTTKFGTFTVGAPYEFPEVDLGNVGDTYRDDTAPAGTLVLYGPKTSGGWGAAQTFVSKDSSAPVVLYSDNLGNGYRLVVADDGTLSTEPA